MNLTTNDIITGVSIIVIIVVFLFYSKGLIKMLLAWKAIIKSLESDDVLSALEKTSLKTIVELYRSSLNTKQKMNVPASEYFSLQQISKFYKFNLHFLDSAAGTLVGLGLLGTFLGLTYGILGFNSDSVDQIQSSINSLLGGMGTAFFTSLAGMCCSILYTWIDKYSRNMFLRSIHELTEKIDAQYYIDDIELMRQNQQELIQSLYDTLRNDLREHTDSITAKLTYTNSDGQNVTVSNAVREILSENTEQSKALKSFSTDLAIELNNGFDEALSRQMQSKILPLMESVDTTTKAVIEHIDQMAQTVSSPATDMIQSVVDDLKLSMQSIIDEFNHGLSGSATAELENLASQLGTANQLMANFPRDMENISSTLQVTIEEVKKAISEITNTSATANSAAMQNMQEQIVFATGSINDAVEKVKDVMCNLSRSSQEQSNQMVNKLADAADKMGTFLTGTISSLSTSVQQSVKNITEEVNDKQADLIALQEDTTNQTKKLLDTFNASLDRLEKMTDYVNGTINSFKQVQGEISISSGNLRSISSDMKHATELFNHGQSDYTTKFAQLQTNSQQGIDKIASLLKDSGQLSEEYVQKFEIIKVGLSSIFTQLQSGLTEYSRTVKDSTDKYLEQYASSLTQTTGALMSSIERQSEVTEILSETISKIKG